MRNKRNYWISIPILSRNSSPDIIPPKNNQHSQSCPLENLLPAYRPPVHGGRADCFQKPHLVRGQHGGHLAFLAVQETPSCDSDWPLYHTCQRHYSDLDTDRGWDSNNNCWYFGHSLYMLSYRNDSLKIELPITMKFTKTRRDSKNFLYAIDDFGRHSFGLFPKNICLDSAHDNIPTYELLEH